MTFEIKSLQPDEVDAFLIAHGTSIDDVRTPLPSPSRPRVGLAEDCGPCKMTFLPRRARVFGIREKMSSFTRAALSTRTRTIQFNSNQYLTVPASVWLGGLAWRWGLGHGVGLGILGCVDGVDGVGRVGRVSRVGRVEEFGRMAKNM